MKKFLCAILALVMILSLAACGGETEKKPTEPSTPTVPEKPTGTQLWEKADELPKSGDYKLTCDVTVTESIYVEDSLILDLNGFTITRSVSADELTDQQAIRAPEGTSLTIKDTSAEGKGTMKVSYPAGTQCVSPAALIHGDETSVIVIDGGTYDCAGMESIYASANGGVFATGGKLTINKAVVYGYKNVASGTSGCGTVLGIWSDGEVIINDGKFVGGGSKGNAATIASKGILTINGGEFSVDAALTGNVSRHAALILTEMNSARTTSLTINGGTFTGAQVEHGGGCFNAACPTTITGGTFYAGQAYQGGVILANKQPLTVTGGTFYGKEGATTNVGGIISALGKTLTITGGTFNGVNDSNHGYNVFYDYVGGQLTIGGDAKLNGGVAVRSLSPKICAMLNITGNPQISTADKTVGTAKYAIKLSNADLCIEKQPTEAKSGVAEATKTNYMLAELIYDAEGNITGAKNSD